MPRPHPFCCSSPVLGLSLFLGIDVSALFSLLKPNFGQFLSVNSSIRFRLDLFYPLCSCLFSRCRFSLPTALVPERLQLGPRYRLVLLRSRSRRIVRGLLRGRCQSALSYDGHDGLLQLRPGRPLSQGEKLLVVKSGVGQGLGKWEL